MKRFAAIGLVCLLIAFSAQAQAEAVFKPGGYDPFTNERYAVLDYAQVNGLHFRRAGDHNYLVSDGDYTLRWQAEGIEEEGFQAFAMPESLAQVRGMNRVMAYLNDEPCVERRGREAFRRGGLSAAALWEIPLTLTLREDAVMTDDPYGSCAEMKAFASGESVTCIGYFDALWVLAETEIGGENVRGFIPLRSFDVPQEEALDEAADHLTGRWLFYSGGELLGMAVEFCENGTMIRYGYDDGEAGMAIPYAVYAAPEGRYEGNVPYVLELTYPDGMVMRYGIEFLEGE